MHKPVYYELSLLRNYAKLCESMLKKAFESFVLFLEVVIIFKNIHFLLVTFFYYSNFLGIKGGRISPGPALFGKFVGFCGNSPKFYLKNYAKIMKVCGKNITKYDGLVVLSQSSIRMKRPPFYC